MSPLLHSRIGASGAARWIACPGSIAATANLPPQPPSPAALRGTAAHAVAEACLLGERDAAFYLGTAFDGIEVDEAMAASVQVYLDTVRWHQSRMAGCRMHVEAAVDLSWIHPGMFGTADAILVEPWGEAVVIDYKSGTDPVDVTGPQLPFYALGPWHEHHCRHVTCVIVQPAAGHVDGPVRSVRYSSEQMREWADRFRVAALATERADAPRVAGSHCTYCAAAGSCPALHQLAVRVAGSEFAPAVRPPAPHTLTPQQVATVLEHADTIEAWIGAVRQHALALASGGTPVPGFKLVEGRRGNRAWIDEVAAAKALADAGIDPYERVLLSPAAADKRLGKAAKTVLAPLVAQAPGKPQLAPESDRRPAIAAPAAADFKDLPAA